MISKCQTLVTEALPNQFSLQNIIPIILEYALHPSFISYSSLIKQNSIFSSALPPVCMAYKYKDVSIILSTKERLESQIFEHTFEVDKQKVGWQKDTILDRKKEPVSAFAFPFFFLGGFDQVICWDIRNMNRNTLLNFHSIYTSVQTLSICDDCLAIGILIKGHTTTNGIVFFNLRENTIPRIHWEEGGELMQIHLTWNHLRIIKQMDGNEFQISSYTFSFSSASSLTSS